MDGLRWKLKITKLILALMHLSWQHFIRWNCSISQIFAEIGCLCLEKIQTEHEFWILAICKLFFDENFQKPKRILALEWCFGRMKNKTPKHDLGHLALMVFGKNYFLMAILPNANCQSSYMFLRILYKRLTLFVFAELLNPILRTLIWPILAI